MSLPLNNSKIQSYRHPHRHPKLVAFIAAAFFTVSGATSISFAAKPSLQPTLETKTETTSTAKPDEIERAKMVHPTEPPAVSLPVVSDLFLFRHRHSLTLRGGLGIPLADLKNPGSILGFMYWWPRENLKHDFHGLEAGADLDRDGNGTIYLTHRVLVGRDRFRWFYKIGGGLRVIASDQLITFLRARNWRFRAGTGLEQSVSESTSLRFDIEASLGTERSEVLSTLGLSFGW